MSATGDPAAGFTLLETLTALAVAALAGAIAFPMLDKAISAAVLAQSRAEVRSDLAAARAEAMRTDAPVEFAVAADGAGYGWRAADAHHLPSSARLQGPEAPLVFYADGSARASMLTLSVGPRKAELTVMATGVVADAP